MAKVNRVKYFTEEKLNLIDEDNMKKYKKYLQSCIIKNKDVKETTYKVYENYFKHFLVFLAENYDNIGLYSEEFMDNAVDIMEGYIMFCQDTLLNNKKVINTKLSAVSSFYLWSLKRGLIDKHPFDKKLERMKGANEEHIINSYFLTKEQVQEVRRKISEEDKFTIQDEILWEIAIDSANRVGALSKLTLSTLDLDSCVFNDIREKRGYHVEVVFGDKAKELIKEWLEMRKEDYDHLEVDNIFITKYGGKWKPMSYSTIQDKMNEYGKLIGIEDFHCHCTRKTTINNIVEDTGDITLASQYANHKDIGITQQSYVKKKSKTEIKERIEQLRKSNSK